MNRGDSLRPRASERVAAFLLGANVFVLLACYYLVKTVREALILTEGGAEVKSYSAAGQAMLLLVLVPLYGALASRMNRFRLIASVSGFFISNLLLFFALGRGGVSVGVPFFIWVGIFNVMIVAQFWSFATDAFTEDQGKRLLPVIGIGSSVGALAGAKSARALFQVLDPYQMMLLASALLGIGIAITWMAQRHILAHSSAQRSIFARPLSRTGGFQLISSSRYLLLIASLVLLLNVVNTTGEFLLSKHVMAEAERVIGSGPGSAALKQKFIGTFYANFFSWVSLLGLLLQTFVTARLFRWIGVSGTLFILPCIALGGYGLMALAPGLLIVQMVKILENSTDYSVYNTARHALFMPVSREAKYKAKAAIDTFFWRAGDVAQAGLVFFGARLALTLEQFALVNMVSVGAWLVIVVLISREHRKLRRVLQLPKPPAPIAARHALAS